MLLIKKNAAICLAILSLGFLVSCQTAYYEVWEKLGKEKRDLLQDHVRAVKGEQGELQEEFKDALERLRTEYPQKAGNLERLYDRFSNDYETVNGQNDAIDKRIGKVNRIASDLFVEWKREANTITNAKWKRDSLSKLERSKAQFAKMRVGIEIMKKRVKPVLAKMRDYRLYLKHNLNAKSMHALKAESNTIGKAIESLIASIQASMAEAEAFEKTLET